MLSQLYPVQGYVEHKEGVSQLQVGAQTKGEEEEGESAKKSVAHSLQRTPHP